MAPLASRSPSTTGAGVWTEYVAPHDTMGSSPTVDTSDYAAGTKWEFGWLPDDRVVTVASLPPDWPTTMEPARNASGTDAHLPATWLAREYRGASGRQPAHAGAAAALERARLTGSADVWTLTPGAVRAVGITVNNTHFAAIPPAEGRPNEGSVELHPDGGGMTLYGPVAVDSVTMGLNGMDVGNITRSDAFLTFRALSANLEQPETQWRTVYATVLSRAATPAAISTQAQRGIVLYDTVANFGHVGPNLLVRASCKDGTPPRPSPHLCRLLHCRLTRRPSRPCPTTHTCGVARRTCMDR